MQVFNSHLRDLGSRRVLHSSRLCKLVYLPSWLKALAVKFSLLSSRSGLNFSLIGFNASQLIVPCIHCSFAYFVKPFHFSAVFSVQCLKKAVALKLQQIFIVFGTLHPNSPNFSMHALLSTSPHIYLPQSAIYLDSRT